MVGDPVVAAVVVTYGDRGHLVSRCVAALRAQTSPPDRIVVVWNGVPALPLGGIVEDVRLPRNLGSAGGFAAGLDAAMEDPATTHVWLHDDDALPRPDALGALLERVSVAPDRLYLSLREDRSTYARYAAGAPVAAVFPPVSAIAGFDLLRALRRRLGPYRRREESDRQLPVAPYGGLLVPRPALARVEPPDATFFTYADDHEWSRRLRAGGYAIELVAESRVADQDGTQATGSGARVAALADPSPGGLARSVLTVRNTAYVALRRSPIRATVNLLALLVMLLLRTPGGHGLRRAAVLLRAASEAATGRMGTSLPVDWRGRRVEAAALLAGDGSR